MNDKTTYPIDAPEQQNTIAIDDGSGPQTPQLPPEVAVPRADKASYGLSDKTDISKGEFNTALATGQEDQARQAAASKVDEKKLSFAKQVISKYGDQMTDEQLKGLVEKSDPQSIFEEYYARAYVSNLDWTKGDEKKKDNWSQQYQTQYPEEYDELKKSGSEFLAKNEFARTILENAEGKNHWYNTAALIGKDIFSLGFYSEYVLRQNTADTGMLSGLGLGSNQLEQSKNLWNLPYPEFKKELQRVYNNISSYSPSLASQWVSNMLFMGDDARVASDLLTGINLIPVVGIASKVVKGLSRSELTSKGVSAVKDMVRPKPDVVPAEVAAPATAGNLKDSAIKNVKIDAINELADADNPAKIMADRLSSNYDVDDRLAANSPGRLGREMSNRISDIWQSQKERFLSTVFGSKDRLGAQRVDRTPTVELEANIRNIQENLADIHRGVDNTVLNVSKPLYVEGLNVRAHNLAVGTFDGELFGSEAEALANAKKNGWAIKGDYNVDPKTLREVRAIENLIKAYDAVSERGITSAKNMALSAEDRVAIEAFENEGGAIGRENRAKEYADRLRQRLAEYPGHETGVTIKQQGNGFYINKVVYLPEHADFVRDGLVTSDIGKMTTAEFRKSLADKGLSTGIPPSWSSGWLNAVLGRFRNPAERLSQVENMNRLIATHGPSVLLGLIKQGAKPLAEIPKKYWNDFNRLIRYAQKAHNPEQGVPGMWFDSPSQIEDFYNRTFKRNPEASEIAGYFAYKALMVDDLNFRELSVMQRKLVLGFEQHRLQYKGADGKKAASDYFEGVRHQTLPRDGRNALISYGDDRKPKVYRNNASFFPKEVLKDIEAGKAKVIQIADPRSRPLQDLHKKRVDYVVSYNTDSKPIGFHHVNRLGGGHMIPAWDWFIKSANVDIDGNLRIYNGDNTLMSMKTKAEAAEAVSVLEKVRQAFKRHKDTMLNPEDLADVQRWEGEGGALAKVDHLQEAADLAKDTGIPFHKFHDWFFGKNGREPVYDVNEPFHVVSKGGLIGQLGEEGAALRARHRVVDEGGLTHELIDASREDSLLGKAMVEFTQERDAQGLYTLRKTNTESHPTYAYEPADILDPITSMERSYSRIVNSMYMYDMKQFSMEHWLQQARDFLDIKDISEIRQNPLQWFYNPRYKENIPNQIRLQLESNRQQAHDFIGTPSKFDTSLREIAQAQADQLYENKGIKLEPLYKVPTLKNINNWLRHVAFYMTQYSPKAFWTQATTLANVYALSPRHAPSATAAMMAYGWWKALGGTPEILKGLDAKLASGFHIPGTVNFKLGQFEEAVKHLEASGFGHIGNTHAFSSDVHTLGFQRMDNINSISIATKTLQKAGRTVLDAGGIPFNTGAASTRVAGFFTSYLEHVNKAPAGVLDRQMQASMLNRAALLDHNMSSAFSTKLHTGAMSIPAQFMAYDIRLAEMMYGKNLTPIEKARLFATSSMMYGLRGGGLLLFGFPIANWTVNQLEDKLGYNPGENAMMDLLVNGFPSWAFAYLSGGFDSSKGAWEDFSKWGNKGVDMIEKFFDSDKSMAAVLGGVVGNVFYNTLQDTWGVRQVISSLGFRDYFPITSDDVVDVFKEFAAERDTWKAWMAFQTGRWMTKNESWITNITKAQSMFTFATGVEPVQARLVWNKEQLLKDEGQKIKWFQSKFELEVSRALISGSNGDKDNYDVHMKRANTILQAFIPVNMWGQTNAEAMRKANQSLLERVDAKFYIKYKNDWDAYARSQKGK